ncbi:MAG: SprT family zinc-dependent metalloprotease [Candidatus Sedimenticola sp. (ex Thyasira tokunagai)]
MSELTKAKEMLTVNGIAVQVVRKEIKNLHLGVYPPDGRVRVAAPKHITDDNVRLAVVSKLSWIRKQQQVFKDQLRQSERRYVSGECHYFFGRRCRLELIELEAKPEIKLLRSGKLKMCVRPGAALATKEKLLNAWYREELKKLIPELLDKWQPVVGRQIKDWGIKKMKTKWGSCNVEQRRIWLNLELAKKPPECLEYILVHELVHLIERNHNQRFIEWMDQFLPDWRISKKILNTSPLANEDWIY